MDKLNRGLSTYEVMVEDADTNLKDVKEILPMLQGMNKERLEQVKGLLKLLGK